MKKLVLADYKGKYDIIMDEDCADDLDFIVGEISKEDALEEASERIENCTYYGVPAYIGNDPDLLKAYKVNPIHHEQS